jgi:hypothetical protein
MNKFFQMRVNIIGAQRKTTGLQQDGMLLHGALGLSFEDKIQVRMIPSFYPQCPDAEYNIFLEVINPALFPFARKNILIPNVEWTYSTWVPYLNMFDEIWAKTHEAELILKEHTTTPIRYIGWSSLDKMWNPDEDKKNYFKALVPLGKNIYREWKPIFEAYSQIKKNNLALFVKLPKLYVVHSPADVQVEVPEDLAEKVVLKSEVMKENDYSDLVRECGLCICLSQAEGFGHAVNEAISAGCNLIVSSISPFQHDLLSGYQSGIQFVEPASKTPQVDCLGILVQSNVESLVQALERYCSYPVAMKQEYSKEIREIYCRRHRIWIDTMKDVLSTWDLQAEEYAVKSMLPKEDALPDVSIVTITKDRRVFMPLLKYSYMIQSYPEDKLELVIVDDGDDSIEDTLIGVPNVKYVRVQDRKMTISEKRNLGVENAMYDIVAFMDDDDVYPNNSILQRTAMMLMEPRKECAFCTTIPCYDIVKFSSFMNVPPTSLAMSERVSEASLIFTKNFWNERKFDDSVHIGEGNAFIHGREQMCRELSPQEVIVSLVHPKNTSSRKLPDFKEPNGCHWGFNEKLFDVVTQIGQTLNTSSQRENA